MRCQGEHLENEESPTEPSHLLIVMLLHTCMIRSDRVFALAIVTSYDI